MEEKIKAIVTYRHSITKGGRCRAGITFPYRIPTEVELTKEQLGKIKADKAFEIEIKCETKVEAKKEVIEKEETKEETKEEVIEKQEVNELLIGEELKEFAESFQKNKGGRPKKNQ
jgi:hypothetical protein